jgi:general secretion pathway protein D
VSGARSRTWPAVAAALLLVLPWTIVHAETPEAAPSSPPAASPAMPKAEAPPTATPSEPIPSPEEAPAAAPPQEETPSVPTATGTTSENASPASIPVAAPAPKKPLEGPLLLNFKDASLRAVLEYLSAAAGLVIVEEASVEGRVTVMSLQPLSVDEAVALLNTILKEKGYAAIRTGRTLKIVTLADAKKAALPVHSGADPEKIEPSDQLVTYVIPIQFADATALKRDLATLIPAYADLQANASTNTLILTDTQTNVRRIVEIIRALDSQTAGVSEVKVFQLQYANAATAARLITDLFKSDPSTGGGAGGRGPGGAMAAFLSGRGRGGPGGQGGPAPSEEATTAGGGRQQKVTASADDRTNTLVVSAPPDLLKVIEGVVEQLDANPAADQAVFTYRLKNANASNLEAVLNNLFGWSGGGSTAGRTGTATSGTNRSVLGFTGSGGRSGGTSGSSSAMRGLGTSRSTSGTSGARTGTTSTAFAGRGGTARLSASAAQAASDLSGKVYVVAEPDTNSLLVTTSTKNFPRVQAILDELDRAVPQVLIKVLVAEVTHEKTLDLGVEASILNMSTATGPGYKGGTNFSVTAKTTGLVFSLIEDNVTVALRAIAGVGKLDVLSRPYILTSDNQQASIMVGQSVPTPTGSQITDSGQTNTSFLYNDVGIMLTVTPHINPDGLVIMDVYQEISAISDSTVQLSSTVNAPVFNKRVAQSRVSILDGQTIVIGGLMEDRITDHVDKVPYLGDIPGLGVLFRRTTKDKTKTELLLFLTPHVARVPNDLKVMSEGEQAGTKVIQDAVEPGAFEEHMKGMRQGAAPPPEENPSAPPAEQDPDDPKSP